MLYGKYALIPSPHQLILNQNTYIQYYINFCISAIFCMQIIIIHNRSKGSRVIFGDTDPQLYIPPLVYTDLDNEKEWAIPLDK